MGLGRAGAVSAAKQGGGVISIVLLTVYRVIDYFLTDQATLSQLVDSLATDIVKVGIVTGASIVAAGAMAAVTTFAVGPIVAVIVTGLIASSLLGQIDKNYGITDRVIAGLDDLGDNAADYIETQKRNVNRLINHAIDSIKAITKQKEYLSPSFPRQY